MCFQVFHHFNCFLGLTSTASTRFSPHLDTFSTLFDHFQKFPSEHGGGWGVKTLRPVILTSPKVYNDLRDYIVCFFRASCTMRDGQYCVMIWVLRDERAAFGRPKTLAPPWVLSILGNPTITYSSPVKFDGFSVEKSQAEAFFRNASTISTRNVRSKF